MVLPDPRTFVGVPHGQKQNDPNEERKILAGSEDPTADGVVAPLGSLFLRDNGLIYRKSGATNTDWTQLDDSDFAATLDTTFAAGPFTAVAVPVTLGPFAIPDGHRGEIVASFTLAETGAGGTLNFRVNSSAEGNGPTRIEVVADGETRAITETFAVEYSPAANETVSFEILVATTISITDVRLTLKTFPQGAVAGA